jgi:NAD(P)-dependent dehydrogenase (short-subunit alcohol dehydrogenase family)
MEPLPLADHRALVIGAGTAAGRVAAIALARAGADVACAATSLDGDEVMATRRTRRAVEALGRRAPEYAFDLTLGQNVRVSMRQVAKDLGGLDVLVIAAETYLRGPAAQTSDAEWTRGLAGGLGGVFYACRSALHEMSDRGGRIICLVSGLALRGAPEHAVYCAAQHGIIGLVRALAAEGAGQGITVNAVVLERLHAESGQPAGTAEDEALGALIALLASPAGAGLTGQVIGVGG